MVIHLKNMIGLGNLELVAESYYAFPFLERHEVVVLQERLLALLEKVVRKNATAQKVEEHMECVKVLQMEVERGEMPSKGVVQKHKVELLLELWMMVEETLGATPLVAVEARNVEALPRGLESKRLEEKLVVEEG